MVKLSEVQNSAEEFSHGLDFRRPKSSEAKRRFVCTNLIDRKLKIWRNAKMPSKMSDNADIICVEHCEQKIFAVGSFPGTCSQCQINLKDCDLKIPPFSVPTPFSRWASFWYFLIMVIWIVKFPSTKVDIFLAKN